MLIISCYQFTLIRQAAQITAEASDSSSLLELAALVTILTPAFGSRCGEEKVIGLAAAVYIRKSEAEPIDSSTCFKCDFFFSSQKLS